MLFLMIFISCIDIIAMTITGIAMFQKNAVYACFGSFIGVALCASIIMLWALYAKI